MTPLAQVLTAITIVGVPATLGACVWNAIVRARPFACPKCSQVPVTDNFARHADPTASRWKSAEEFDRFFLQR